MILQDPRKLQGHARDEAMRHNRDAFARLARVKEGDQSRLLVKATGGLDHGGGDVLKPGSEGLPHPGGVRPPDQRTADRRRPVVDDKNRPPFFDGVVMLDDRNGCSGASRCRWRAGCRPTSEMAAVADEGLDGAARRFSMR